MNHVAGPLVPHPAAGLGGFAQNPSASALYNIDGGGGVGGSGYYGSPTAQQQPVASHVPAGYQYGSMASVSAGSMQHQHQHQQHQNQHQQHQQQLNQQQYAGHQNQPQPYAYTSAPFSQSVPAQVPLAQSSRQPQQQPQVQQHHDQQQSQHPLSRHSLSASPQQRLSPAHVQQQLGHSPQAASTSRHTPPSTKYPMAAPPLPQTPASNLQQHAQQNQHQAQSTGSPRTPQSPGSQNREQARVSLLLDLNMELLQEVTRLQLEGKGGAISPQQVAQLRNEGKPADMASEEYIQVLRRVQANLGYLMPKAQNDAQKTPRGPAHMTPPPHMPQLQGKYNQLRELFPDWQGMDHRMSQSSSSPHPPGTGGPQSANGSANAPFAKSPA